MLYVDLTLLYNGGKPSTVKDKYIKGELVKSQDNGDKDKRSHIDPY